MRPGTWIVALEGLVHGALVRHSIALLRISMGLVFLGFGLLKYFPGVSPAQDLVVSTTRLLTLGLVPDGVALVLVATLECIIGITLIAGRGLRVVIYLLVAQLVGILSPLVLLPYRLFAGPFHAPTLEGQYVLKDIVLVGAALVIATTFRGARIAHRDGPVVPEAQEHRRPVGAAEKLAVVMSGFRGDSPVRVLCRRHDIGVEEYAQWRQEVLDGALRSLETSSTDAGPRSTAERPTA